MKERIRRLLGKKAEASKILLSLVFISLVIIPLFRMFLNIDRDSIQKVFTSANFGKVICNSLLATGIATVITVIIAYLLALCISRTDIRFKKFFRIIFVLPMLIPLKVVVRVMLSSMGSRSWRQRMALTQNAAEPATIERRISSQRQVLS